MKIIVQVYLHFLHKQTEFFQQNCSKTAFALQTTRKQVEVKKEGIDSSNSA